MNDIEIAKLKKQNRYGWFKIAEHAMDQSAAEVKRALELVHIVQVDKDEKNRLTKYRGYSAEFLPLAKGQPPLEYGALMDPTTRKFVKFKAKGIL